MPDAADTDAAAREAALLMAPAGFVGGNQVRLLQGGDELFPAMRRAMESAHGQVWLATYIFHDDAAGLAMIDALRAAARRGVVVHVMVDGFGSRTTLPRLRDELVAHGVLLDVFRPLDRWTAWLQPAQLRRLHHKLCVVDDTVAFVGGINILDDRFDLVHGLGERPRLDFAVELRGPAVRQVQRLAQALQTRARLGQEWRSEVGALVRSGHPMSNTLQLWRQLRGRTRPDEAVRDTGRPVRVAFVARDNLRRRRAIERRYLEAVRFARHSIDIACPYFYPRRAFTRRLLAAAQRGVRVRLLMQGKVDYPLAALAARVLYDELLAHGVRIYEYTPAFLHAKVAVVDARWATVGSSNIDPLSLLLNLEANAVVQDEAFAQLLQQRLDAAFAESREIHAPPLAEGWRRWLSRGVVAWCANLYLRVAGITGRY